MSDSMYQGKRRFTREQLIFAVELIFEGAIDRIETQLPPCVPRKVFLEHKDSIGSYVDGCVHTMSHQLACLIAQVTNDGCGTFDWALCAEWNDALDAFLKERTARAFRGLKPGDKCHPDQRRWAEKFVDRNFPDYKFANAA